MDPRKKKAKNRRSKKTKKQKKLRKAEKTKTCVRKKVGEKVRRKIQTYPPHYILDERQKNWKKNRNQWLPRPHEQKTKKNKKLEKINTHRTCDSCVCVCFWEQP